MESPKDVFVIMPFSSTVSLSEPEWTEIYDHVFKPAIEECGYSCQRAIPKTGSLIRSIIEKLRNARIVLADITDRNPNVFYELGVRHSLSKRTIIVAQGNQHPPSDLLGYWFIRYGKEPAQVTRFKKDIKRLIADIESEPDKSDNPVSDYLDQENLVVSNYAQKENIKKLGALYTEFSGNMVQLAALIVDPATTPYITYDCLKLLLQTLYIDIGPDLLKVAYELFYRLRSLELGIRDKERLQGAINDITTLSNEILAIRNRLILGQYSEPSAVSTMIWKPSALLSSFLLRKDSLGSNEDSISDTTMVDHFYAHCLSRAGNDLSWLNEMIQNSSLVMPSNRRKRGAEIGDHWINLKVGSKSRKNKALSKKGSKK
jgi:hypothetical protein